MFVSKLLNKLFFNTNNDCYFTTLLNLNQFMLTVENHKAILDRSISEGNTSMASPPECFLDSLSRIPEGNPTTNDGFSQKNEANISYDSLDDEALLKRKHEWTTTNDPIFINEEDNVRCISPIPFPLSEQNTPEGNTSMASPSECFLDSLSRIPKGNPTTNENKFRPIEPILSEFSGAYSPKQPDTLFWSIFIIANGYGEYINIDRNYGVKELEIKKKVCDFLQKNPSKLKHTNYKITKAGVQEVISELLTSNKETSFNCLLALCVYYNINVVLIHPTGKLMLEFLSYDQEETPYYVLKKDTYGKYSVDTDKKTWKEVQEMKTQLICIVNYMKPMKAAGNYKMEDLEELAEKMGVLDATKKYKKAELYQLVSDSINWSRG